MSFVIKVTLKDIRPPLWRRLQVADDVMLDELHMIIQAAMGWAGYHLHDFVVDGARYGVPSRTDLDSQTLDERKVALRDVAQVKSRLRYTYDFGDDWEHEVLVEKIVAAAAEPRAVCLGGRRACPPEDCGGPPGYAELLEVLADPSHPEHLDRLEWLGGSYDPAAFDAAAVNRRLATLARAPATTKRGVRPRPRHA